MNYSGFSRDRCNKSFHTILGPFWCFSYALYGNRKNTRRVPILLIPKNVIQSCWPAKDSEVILVSRPRHLLPYSNFIQFNKIEEKTPMLLNIFFRDIGQTILFLSSIFLLSIVPTKNRWENFFLPMAVLFFSGYVSNFIRFSSFWEATIKLEQEERPQPLQPPRPGFSP